MQRVPQSTCSCLQVLWCSDTTSECKRLDADVQTDGHSSQGIRKLIATIRHEPQNRQGWT